jgi:hypothetical protein
MVEGTEISIKMPMVLDEEANTFCQAVFYKNKISS